MPWAFSLPGQRWLGRDYAWAEPQALPRTAIYHPHKAGATE
jgi:cobaltochelatase CobN